MVEGQITISRISSNSREEYVSIVLRREQGAGLIKIELSLEDYALLVTGRALIPCKYEEVKYTNR